MNRLVVFVALAFLSGCNLLQAVDDGVSIRTDKTRYRVGEAATVRVTNRTDKVVRFVFLCTYQLQRREDAGWETIHCAACPLNARVGAEVIEPGTVLEAQVRLVVDDSLKVDTAAAYRLHFTTFFEGEPPLSGEAAASNAFQLRM